MCLTLTQLMSTPAYVWSQEERLRLKCALKPRAQSGTAKCQYMLVELMQGLKMNI